MRFALPLLFAGCSFATTSRAPIPPQAEPECTTSVAPAVVDVALGLGTLIGGLAFTGKVAEDTEDGPQTVTAFVFSSTIAGAILFGISAYAGGTRPSRCEQARAMWAKNPVTAVPAVVPPPAEVVPDVPLVEAVTARDPLAAQLTLQAHRAALRNNCAGVQVMGARVRELDAEYYARVFVVDPPIARCR